MDKKFGRQDAPLHHLTAAISSGILSIAILIA
jgi:hypothetical protein